MTEPSDATPSSTPEPRPSTDPGHDPPSVPGAERPPIGEPHPDTNVGLDRGYVIGHAMRTFAEWCLRAIIIAVAVGGVLWILSKVWEGILPIFFALLLTSLLWPVVRFLIGRGVPVSLASIGVIIVTIAVVVGVMVAIAPSVAGQSSELVGKAADGVIKLRDWVSGPPLNIENERLNDLSDQAQQWLQDRSATIASGVFTGVTTIGSVVPTALVIVVLTFFFLKDGRRFLPWVRRIAGRQAGEHLTELFMRIWNTVSGFLRVQMLVSAVDAILIGASGTGAALPQVALRERGYTALVYQTHGAATFDFIRIAGKAAEGVIMASGPVMAPEGQDDTALTKKPGLALNAAYEKKYGENSRNQFGAHMYDTFEVLKRVVPVALRTAKPGTQEFREAIRLALLSEKDIAASQAVYNFTEKDRFGVDDRSRILLTVKDGKYVVIK